MQRVTVFILKDSLLLDKQRKVQTRTYIREGYAEPAARTAAAEKISDVQCVYAITINSTEVSTKTIAKEVAGDKSYRLHVSSF